MNKKLNNCKYCNISFEDLNTSQRANHSRWCDLNPKRKEYINSLKERDYKISDKSRIERNKKISEAHKRGAYSNADHGKAFRGKKHSDETKEKIRNSALNSKHRRLKKGVADYNGILLDSSWEVELAKRLDELNIRWSRPNPIPWVDNDGITHNYFPDFYLEDYNLYLDPKNPQAVRSQKEKLECLFKQYNNIVILYTLKQCKEYCI